MRFRESLYSTGYLWHRVKLYGLSFSAEHTTVSTEWICFLMTNIPEPNSSAITVTIPPSLERQRLDKVLAQLMSDHEAPLSRARLQSLLADKQIEIAGKPVTDASRKVKIGESYTIHIPPPEAALPEAQTIALDIVYEDDDVIVINKPVGMVVHPAPGNREIIPW